SERHTQVGAADNQLADLAPHGLAVLVEDRRVDAGDRTREAAGSRWRQEISADEAAATLGAPGVVHDGQLAPPHDLEEPAPGFRRPGAVPSPSPCRSPTSRAPSPGRPCRVPSPERL